MTFRPVALAIMLFLIVPGDVVAAAPPPILQTIIPAQKLRFDGIYQSSGTDEDAPTRIQVDQIGRDVRVKATTYYRFYADGSVVTVNSPETATAVAKSMHRSAPVANVGRYAVVDDKVTFTVSRCDLCPPEIAYHGQLLRDGQIHFKYNSFVGRGLRGQHRGEATATFVNATLPTDDSVVAQRRLPLSDRHIAELNSATVADIKRPSSEFLAGIASAKTIGITFEGGRSWDYGWIEELLAAHPVDALVEEIGRRHALTMGADADIAITVGNVRITKYESPGPSGPLQRACGSKGEFAWRSGE